eukprot:scaffold5201_cov313-Prasinococcus_capsulatus_cf.AAC.1
MGKEGRAARRPPFAARGARGRGAPRPRRKPSSPAPRRRSPPAAAAAPPPPAGGPPLQDDQERPGRLAHADDAPSRVSAPLRRARSPRAPSPRPGPPPPARPPPAPPRRRAAAPLPDARTEAAAASASAGGLGARQADAAERGAGHVPSSFASGWTSSTTSSLS